MITQTFLDKQANWMINQIDYADVRIDGSYQQIDIYDTDYSDNELSIYILLDNQVSGEVTEIRLIDVDGDTVKTQPDSIEKPSERLMLATFRFKLIEEIIEEEE